MGLYPTIKYDILSKDALQQVTSVPGLKTIKVYQLIAEIEDRTDCYCCTCPEDASYPDSACRNHGFYGRRPCDIHDMPGSVWDDTGEMPTPVREYRERLLKQRSSWR